MPNTLEIMQKFSKTIISILILLVCISACTNKQKSDEQLELIDIGNAYKQPLKELLLSDVVESIDYIKLETKPGTYIGRVGDLAISKNFVVMYFHDTNRIMLFSRNGGYLNDIGEFGKGPGEYSNVDQGSLKISPDEKSILFSENARELFMFCISGEFVKSVTLPLTSDRKLNILDEGDIIVYQNRKFQDNSNGHVLLRYDNNLNLLDSMFYSEWDKSLNGRTYSPDMIFINNNDLYFKQFFNDTVFRIDYSGKESPAFQISLGDLQIQSLKLHYNETWSKDFMIEAIHFSEKFILTILLGRLRNPQPRNWGNELAWYNRGNKEIFMTKLFAKNDLDGIDLVLRPRTQNNVFWDMIDVIDYKPFVENDSFDVESLHNQKYYRELKSLLKDSKIDDNPIIRIFNLK